MNIIGKTKRYLQRNGVSATAKKIVRRTMGRDWLPTEEDALYAVKPFIVPERERWQMPAAFAAYPGTVSVVIPCYNGARELPRLLERLLAQIGIGRLEIVVVDSGSRDGTAELAEARGARVIRITQEAFSHAYARKLGAEHACGEYLLFMTQDALPDRTDWIISLLQPALLGGAAAVSCVEQPCPDADLISRVTAWNWRRVMLGDGDRLAHRPEDRSFDTLRRCAMLTDNACLVRAEAYWRLGGHRGTYAEDLDLGLRLLEAGETLGLLSTVSVIHSHTRLPLYYFKRAMVDALRLKELFSDYPLDSLSWRDAVSRVTVAACAGKLFAQALQTAPVQTDPETLCGYIRQVWDQNIRTLRHMGRAEVERFLFAPWPETAGDTHVFAGELWQLLAADYHFDPALAISLARYLMHTVCGYLAETGRMVDAALYDALGVLLWQYFGQSAGYTVAAACRQDGGDRMKAFIENYCAGV